MKPEDQVAFERKYGKAAHKSIFELSTYELRMDAWQAALAHRDAQPAGAQGGVSWATGEPPKWFEEWFIAKLDNGQRVVLKRLPENFTYDYTTADETYYTKIRIAKWMQFPDSEFVSLNPSPAAAINEQLLEALKLATRMFASDGPGLGEIFGALDAAIEQAEAAKKGGV